MIFLYIYGGSFYIGGGKDDHYDGKLAELFFFKGRENSKMMT